VHEGWRRRLYYTLHCVVLIFFFLIKNVYSFSCNVGSDFCCFYFTCVSFVYPSELSRKALKSNVFADDVLQFFTQKHLLLFVVCKFDIPL
jgi:hypothetical protein